MNYFHSNFCVLRHSIVLLKQTIYSYSCFYTGLQTDCMSSPPTLQLAWLDANMYSQENQELLKKIREIHPGTMEFVEKEECERFLGRELPSIRRFIFIVSGKLSEELIREVQNRQDIVSIYVYCGYRKRYEDLFHQNRRVTFQLFFRLFLRLLPK